MEEKLEKSILKPDAAHATFMERNGAMLVGIMLCASLFANCALYQSYAQESSQHAYFARDAASTQKWADGLKKDNDRLQSDIQELTADEAQGLSVSDDAESRALDACLAHPDVSITPWALKTPWELKLHNPEPVMNAQGAWFGPGDACGIDRHSTVRVTRQGDVYVLRPWTPPGVVTEWWACPDRGYRLISAKNEAMFNIVFRACLVKVKAHALGLDPDRR